MRLLLLCGAPAGHQPTAAQSTDQEAVCERVASEVDEERVIALRLIAKLLPKHLNEHVFMNGRQQEELVECFSRILVSTRLRDPQSEETEQSALLRDRRQTLQE